ncbi:MAG TPA: VOC family protein [Rhizomicrobium sp.]|jgi:catechol 2,3-dioxygenase-like lactoylglutathione lyase family enzyme
MIGYVTIGALDVDTSGRFYDAVMGAIGNERKFTDGGWIGYGRKDEDSHTVYVCPPHDGKPATVGNGSMFAFVAHSKDEVRKAYDAGLSSGGKDEGAPGPRPADSKDFYGAYLRDPTGNKICVFAKGPFA